MYRIGLTGGTGSGKSEVAAMLRDLGAKVVTADDLARDLVKEGRAALASIVEAFGPGVLNEDGTLDRRGLAGIVFADGESLSRLNAIVRPPLVEAVLTRMEALERAGESGAIVVDAALLLDWDISDAFDLIVVVRAPLESRVTRLVADGLTRREALARIDAQSTDEEFAAEADLVIDNDGSLAELREHVAALWAGLPIDPDKEES